MYSSGTVLEKLERKINQFIPTLVDFFETRGLAISTSKSSATILTPSTGERKFPLKIKVHGQPVPIEHHPKILGVTLDPSLSFKWHAENTYNRTRQRANILKALAGSTWGQNKETMLMTYKAVGRSVINYGCPVWFPNCAKSNVQLLQRVQNQALRTATGSLKISSEDFLHADTKILPVAEHNTMLTAQYYYQCCSEDHPCHEIATSGPRRRKMKHTVKSMIEETLHTTLPESLSKADIKEKSNAIHTKMVTSTMSRYRIPVVLGGYPPPPVSEDETKLPRATRSKLAQLRSGHSYLLHSYRHRLDKSMPGVWEIPA